MSKEMQLFLETVNPQQHSFVIEIHDYLVEHGCKQIIKEAKSGYVVSYVACNTKHTVATFVMRKSGLMIRIFADHIQTYQNIVESFPQKLKEKIKKASDCKRLLNPEDCNPKCKQGYTFDILQQQVQKCRFMAFMFNLSEENNPFIKQLLVNELSSQ